MPEEIETLMSEEIAGQTLPTSVMLPQEQLAALPDTRSGKQKAGRINKRSLAALQALEDQCRQMVLPLLFHATAPVRSIGFTSAIAGEGKSFLSAAAARAIAEVSPVPVTLLECNWHHATLHEYYGLPATPGLAEWLRGECSMAAIRQRVLPHLSVIPAGNGRQDALGLLQQLRQKGLVERLALANEVFVVDLPPVLSTHYGAAAASLVDALFVVVRAGVTPASMIKQTCARLADAPLQGLVLNQAQSRVPGWIRQLF